MGADGLDGQGGGKPEEKLGPLHATWQGSATGLAHPDLFGPHARAFSFCS